MKIDRKRYLEIIGRKRDENDYISTKNILDLIEQAIKEMENK